MSSSVSFAFVLVVAFSIILLFPLTHRLAPQTALAASIPFSRYISLPPEYSAAPTNVSIPSIGLSAPIIGLGVNNKGEMDVPNGDTDQVGWYEYGTVPGNIGSAVLDAHVFAAFSGLNKIKVGSDIYVQEGSQTLHFVVSQVKLYTLSQLSPTQLFSQTDGRRLNLITCAGTYVPALGTYDHRLVVYATLAA